MPKIVCTIPGAAAEINGTEGVVKFTAQKDGSMLSDEVSAAEAEFFASIPGFALEAVEPAASAEDEAKRADLMARAEAVKLAVDRRWKLPRLTSEVEAAEAAAKSTAGSQQ